MYHPGSTKKKLSKKKTPLQKNPYTGVHFTHSKKENKKSASPAAATATPRHDASWTQKYRCFWLKKRTTKTLPGWWVFVCKNYMVLLYLLDFCWWKKSLKNCFEQETHLFWKVGGDLHLSPCHWNEPFWDPLPAWRFLPSLPRLQVGLLFFGVRQSLVLGSFFVLENWNGEFWTNWTSVIS